MTTTTTPYGTQYLGLLDIPEGTIDDYAIRHEHVEAGVAMRDGNVRTEAIGGQAARTFTYPIRTRWHRLVYKHGTWMTDLPVEQRQMREAATQLHGHVLIGGLGLGVLPSILCGRRRGERVSDMTVIEREERVIRLVADAVRDTMSRRRKITVQHADLFAFLASARAKYDSAFFDIWQSDSEGTFFGTVLPLLRLADKHLKLRPVCWNEDVMRGQLAWSLYGSLLTLAAPPTTVGRIDVNVLREHATGRNAWQRPFWQHIAVKRPAIGGPGALALAQQYAKDYGDPSRRLTLTDRLNVPYGSLLASEDEVIAACQEEDV